MDHRPVQERARAVQDLIFLGGPANSFERIGRMQLIVLLENGLQPWSRVLDFGCGSLRAGWWLMHFLEPGCYHGIEPNSHRVEVACEHICGRELIERAEPTFSHNDDLDMGVFGVQWDFVLARSVWTHASKSEISAMLDSFKSWAAPGGRLLASMLPANSERPDYDGEYGLRSGDRPSVSGLLAHDVRWLESQVKSRKMKMHQLGTRIEHDQIWIRIDA